MRVIENTNELEWNTSSELETPFAEAALESVGYFAAVRRLRALERKSNAVR